MYIAGRSRTASRPSKTLMLVESYVLSFAAMPNFSETFVPKLWFARSVNADLIARAKCAANYL